MESLIDIRQYQGGHYEVNIEGLKRLCPLYKISNGTWIVGNEHLSFGTDIEFTQKIARKLTEKLSRFESECILAAESKSLGIAYEVAKNLGHKHFAIARKHVKPYNEEHIFANIKSITSAKHECLYLDYVNIARIRGKKIILLDDVISTGSTMLGLLKLAEEAGAEVCSLSTIWLEGFGAFENFLEELKSERLVYLDIFPIFATGDTYNELNVKRMMLEKKL